ncbi:MAG: DsbA family protein, partial [Candidatus Micrarchaeota archaeon]
DPYCPWCLAYDPTMNSLKSRYADVLTFEYHILPTHSESLALKYGTENVSLAAKYYACAQNQSKLDEFKACAIAEYNEHTEVPLDKTELDACANSSKLNTTELGACLAGADSILEFSKKLAETYLSPSLSTPAVVLNCQYRTSPRFAESAICYLAPSASACPK